MELFMFKKMLVGRYAKKLQCLAKMITDNILQVKSGIFSPLLCCILLVILLSVANCTNTAGKLPSDSNPSSSRKVVDQDSFASSIQQYEKLLQQKPKSSDRLLFKMGIAYSHPKNRQKDYEKAKACFEKIIDEFPKSKYWTDSQMMLFQISNVLIKDELIERQREQIDAYHRHIKDQDKQIKRLHGELDSLRENIFMYASIPIDKVLIEKDKRRLTLLSKGLAIKTYTVALGKNPIGAKEQQGDGKTPEGWYFIDSKNKLSKFHRSLGLSYPNTKDKKRAQTLGVAPGGDIMIHGLKNGVPDIDDFHATMDWTDGCIAVTNEEIEEIAQIVPEGTPVEIRP